MSGKAGPTGVGDPIVLPVGQYLGALYDDGVTSPRAHLVRIGWQEREVADSGTFDLWLLAHGAWSGRRGQWSRNDLLRAADENGVPDPQTQLRSLEDSRLLVVLTPGTEQVQEFARRHRVHPLMAGLGALDAADRNRSLGIVGQTPLAVVDEHTYDFWQWAHLAPDIWSATTTLMQRPVDDANETYLSPERLLDAILGSIQMLISRGALYVDVVASSAPPRVFDGERSLARESTQPGSSSDRPPLEYSGESS